MKFSCKKKQIISLQNYFLDFISGPKFAPNFKLTQFQMSNSI